MSWSYFFHIYLFLAIASMRNDANNISCLYTNASSNVVSSDGVKQGQTSVFIAIITTPNNNLTEIQTTSTEALRDFKKNDNGTRFHAKVFQLENRNLHESLVKFCDNVVGENVTGVIMTDLLQEGKFNFVPWISSYFGIPVTLLRNTLGFSTKQVLL